MSQNEHQQHGHQAAINVQPAVAAYAEKEVKFNFRENKELGTKRPSVSLPVKVLTLQGLVAILEGGDEKQVNLVLETLQAPIMDQLRAQVDANEAITAETVDYDKLSWDYISKLEPAARRGGGIPKETWEAFVVDYIEVMPAVTGKTAEQITRAASLLGNKLASVKGNKEVLKFLRGQLDLYLSSTAKGEEFAECYEFLVNKADTMLKADAAELLANL